MNCDPNYCSFSINGECVKEICFSRRSDGYCPVFGLICPHIEKDNWKCSRLENIEKYKLKKKNENR